MMMQVIAIHPRYYSFSTRYDNNAMNSVLVVLYVMAVPRGMCQDLYRSVYKAIVPINPRNSNSHNFPPV